MNEEKEHAQALLATVRGVMTGAEIELCEKLVEESDDWMEEEWSEFMDCDRYMLTTLENQFPAEIARGMNQLPGK